MPTSISYIIECGTISFRGKTMMSFSREVKMSHTVMCETSFSNVLTPSSFIVDKNNVATFYHSCKSEVESEYVNESMRIAVSNKQYDIVFFLFQKHGNLIRNFDELLEIVGDECSDNNAYGLLRGKILAEKNAIVLSVF